MILIKAQPHRSSQYFETVCCAGVGRDRRWRRQYPVPFRILKDSQKFGRWQWITYDFVPPKGDPRSESQKVISRSLVAKGKMKQSERASFLAPLVRNSLREADENRDSLALVRPSKIRLEAISKSLDELAAETEKHKQLADQLSLLEDDEAVEPLTPCRMQFVLHWTDQDGRTHRQECDDWETVAAFNRFEREYGEEKAIQNLRAKYEDQYFKAGLVLGFSTHSRRNIEFGTKNQWLLVGLIRLDEDLQAPLF
jgi:polyhydroxyalkanoate synthesis regulator phasin